MFPAAITVHIFIDASHKWYLWATIGLFMYIEFVEMVMGLGEYLTAENMVDVGSLVLMMVYLSIEDSPIKDLSFYVGTLLAFVSALKNLNTILGGKYIAMYTMITLTFIDMAEFLAILGIVLGFFYLLQQGLWKVSPESTLISEHYQNGMGNFGSVY